VFGVSKLLTFANDTIVRDAAAPADIQPAGPMLRLLTALDHLQLPVEVAVRRIAGGRAQLRAVTAIELARAAARLAQLAQHGCAHRAGLYYLGFFFI
jgi:hypothetical protein